jgi:hypothetical protein
MAGEQEPRSRFVSRTAEIRAELVEAGKVVTITPEDEASLRDDDEPYNWMPVALLDNRPEQIYGPNLRPPEDPAAFPEVLKQFNPEEQATIIKFYRLVAQSLAELSLNDAPGSEYDPQP